MNNIRILIVDDDREIRKSVSTVLEHEHYAAKTAQSGAEAMSYLNNEFFDLMILDVKLPGESGIDLIPDIKHIAPEMPIIVITGYAVIDDAVKAMRRGAFDYLKKPFKTKELLLSIDKALKWKEIMDENQSLKEEIQKQFNYKGILGKSKKIKEIISTIKQISDTDVNILITGESGTGKDIVAKAIHYSGIRKESPFIPVNCSSLPDNLLESELFGYKKGAFTGAYRNKDGLFKVADNGTIFLDEIGDMPANLQAKILKVLDSGHFIPLGSTKTEETHARIISATNKDINKMINEKEFREDLFYRINVINIDLPPLRERIKDIPMLIEHFINEYSYKLNRDIKGITPQSMDILMSYPWPGNVRELENVIESSCALTKNNMIDIKSLPDSLFKFNRQSTGEIIPVNKPLKETMDYFEKKYIKELIKFCSGNVSKASKMADIARQNMHIKLKQYSVDPAEYRSK